MAVGFQQGAFKFRRQPVGEHDLEDVSIMDVAFGQLHHVSPGLAVKQRPDVGYKPAYRFFGSGAGFQQVFHVGDLQLCPVPRHVQAVQVDSGNEQDLLTLVVEGDHGIKEHQVQVPERIRILDGNLRRWFRVLDGIVGEPADESSRKGRHAVDPGASVPVHDLPQLDDRIPSLEFQVLDVHDVIDAGDFHTGLIPQKAPAAPGAVFFGALQQIYVAGHVFQDPEGFHGGDEVRKNGCSHGHGVKSQGSISFCIFICGETVHDRLLSMKKNP